MTKLKWKWWTKIPILGLFFFLIESKNAINGNFQCFYFLLFICFFFCSVYRAKISIPAEFVKKWKKIKFSAFKKILKRLKLLHCFSQKIHSSVTVRTCCQKRAKWRMKLEYSNNGSKIRCQCYMQIFQALTYVEGHGWNSSPVWKYTTVTLTPY